MDMINETTWMNPENTTLSERNQTQKLTYCAGPSTRNARTGKSRETKSRLVVA